MIVGTFRRSTRVWAVSTVGTLLLLAAHSAAQDTPPPSSAAPGTGQSPPAASPVAQSAPAPVVTPGTVARKFRGRLPAHYSTVVSSEQRQKIYDIQAGYSEKISDLEKQMAELRAKQDQEVEGVLTAEQRSEVQKLRDASSAKRRGRPTTDATVGTGQG